MLGFIAVTCAFLVVIVKNIADWPTQSTTKLFLELDVGLAGFSAAFLSVREGNLSSWQEYSLFSQMAPDMALIILAAPVFYSLHLWMRHLYPNVQGSAIKIYAKGIIWGVPAVGCLVAWIFVTCAVGYIFPDLGALGILIITTVISMLALVAYLICRANVSRHNVMHFILRCITNIRSVLGGFQRQLVYTALAMLMLLGVIMYGLWVVTLINDPICSSSPEVARGATRVLKTLAFCWIG